MTIDYEDYSITVTNLSLFKKGTLKVFMSADFFNIAKDSFKIGGNKEDVAETYEMLKENTKDIISLEVNDFSLRLYCFMINQTLYFLKENGFPINNKSLIIHCRPDLFNKSEYGVGVVRSITAVDIEGTEIDSEMIFDNRVFKKAWFITFIHEFVHYFLKNTAVESFYMKYENGKVADKNKELVYERFTDCITYFIYTGFFHSLQLQPLSHFGYIGKQIKKNPNYPYEYYEKRIKELKIGR